MISLIICDLDGLLANTEKLHFQAYQATLAEQGIDLNMAEYQKLWIRDGLTIRQFLVKHRLDLDPKRLHLTKVQKYIELVKAEVEPMPYMIEFLNRFKSYKRLAVATSSYLVGAGEVIKSLGIKNYFELIVTRDDVTRLKPDPEIFNLTAEKAGVDNASCLVIEDAQKGIDAAYQAGMKSIAVPDIYTADNDFSNATKVVSSLDEISKEMVDAL